ncbi:hypothetical protein EJP67_29740 [Variovorax guangxiensis]|uniref:Uncharacterized protein n=1 Tax=Variovorax guangxiensis TaxID=1775474 RepID=A0A3S0XK35_9BURK|nr:hypothetical protein [Variovorax guangxiensis]RUR71234.1 hypothetical protein EJP67_29740 [Variovorax guangxiensis]
MLPLRLGVHRVPAIERVVIQTIVRLSAHDTDFAWLLVDAPPYDALLVDETTVGGMDDISRLARVIIRLTRAGASEYPDVLERPIRAEKLQQLLKRIGDNLHGERLPHSGAGGEEMKIEVSDSVRFMLRRWPSALLLGNDPGKVRMASLLVRRELNAIELAELSEQSLSQCATFLHALRQAGVLELYPEVIVPRGQRHIDLPTQTRSPAIHLGRGFFKSIRRRLGLFSA